MNEVIKNIYHKAISEEKRLVLSCRRSIKKSIQANPNLKYLSPSYKAQVMDFWKTRYGITIKPYWHNAYASINNIEDVKYIPEDFLFVKIIPKFNNMRLYKSYADKNISQKIFSDINEPRIYLRNMHGRFYDENYRIASESKIVDFLKMDFTFIIKPSIDSGGGNSVRLGRVKDGKIILGGKEIDFIDLHNMYKSNYIIQENVKQHEKLSKYHPQSLNTLRILTIRLEGEIHHLSSVVRFGDNGDHTDNKGTGGLSCGINDKGKMNEFAIDSKMYKHRKHPFSNCEFKDNEIPDYDKIIDMVKGLHEELIYFDYVSWDVGIREDREPVVIEYNLGYQGIDLHQYNNGPIFKNKFDIIMDKIKI